MNIASEIRQIHARVERETAVERAALLPPESRPADLSELAALRGACETAYQLRNLVGQMPPSPGTLRARIGAYLVRWVQRALFWYTPQITQFHEQVANALDRACKLLDSEARHIATLQHQFSRLRDEVAIVRSETARPRDRVERTASDEPEFHSDHALLDSFLFQLQDKFRGTEAETRGKLGVYLTTIQTADPPVPPGDWLDIGCGRGEWLEAICAAHYSGQGVDSNALAVAHCRKKGLRVTHGDALEFFKSVPDESMAVVTAFHVVEHCSMEHLLRLVCESARALKRGGLFIMETPNPANLLMGSHHFWLDPTHVHPVPAGLMEFIYEYFGLQIVERLDLTPSPASKLLPYDEIETVHRLNEQLYGPQDYGLIGRR